MKIELKKAVAPFKILTVLGVLAVITLTYVHVYYLDNAVSRLSSVSDRFNGDINLLCAYDKCLYIEANSLTYEPYNDYKSMIVVDKYNTDELSWINKLLITKTTVHNPPIIIYSIKWANIVDKIIFVLVVIMLLIIIGLGLIIEKRFISISSKEVDSIREKSSLENNLRMLLAATAHHEMLTPIAVIKASVNKLMMSAEAAREETNKGTFNILVATVDRLESVLNQMSAIRNLYKKPEVRMVTIIKTTLDSLQVIFTEFNFTYQLIKESELINVRNYKLESGTVSNILNNLFKNSLEAGATMIRIVPTITGSKLTLLILDNGSGIPLNADNKLPDIFKLGYSSKSAEPNIINAKEQLSSGTCRGNGLFLIRTILRSAGGDAILVATKPTGTAFKITLPIKQITQE